MIKIAAFARPKSGIDYHRIYAPLRALARDNKDIEVKFGSNFHEFGKDYWNSCTHIIASRSLAVPVDQIEQAANLCREYGKKFIVDVDDYWHLPVQHPKKRMQESSQVPERIEETLTHADIVWTTNKHLAKKIKRYNKNISIIPNGIDRKTPQWQKAKKSSKDVRFGYIAGNFHETDLDAYNIDLGGVESYAMDLGLYPEMLNAKHLLKPLSPDEYGELYSNIDVSIIPLIASDFNKCKSHLKLIEAAFTNTAVICSDVNPYAPYLKNEENCLAVRTPEGWANAVDRLSKDKELVKYLAKNLKEDMAEFEMENVNKLRLKDLQ